MSQDFKRRCNCNGYNHPHELGGFDCKRVYALGEDEPVKPHFDRSGALKWHVGGEVVTDTELMGSLGYAIVEGFWVMPKARRRGA